MEENAAGPEIPKEIEGVDIAISGLHGEDEMLKDIVRNEVVHSVNKLKKFSDIERLKVNVKKADAEGSRARFTVQVTATAGGDFHSDCTEWDLPKTVKCALVKIEKAVSREEDRENVHARAP